MVVDEVGADVEVLPGAVERGELCSRDHLDTVGLTARERLVDAVHGVMVRQRQELDPGRRRGADDAGRRQLTVGPARV